MKSKLRSLGNTLSMSEEEISRIIAYGLAISELETVDTSTSTDHNSILSSIFPSNGSSESLSFEKPTSGFSLSAQNELHPEICVTSEKASLKNKYTLVSTFAKEFYDLRKKCFPSELAYISPISRCRKWNTQGERPRLSLPRQRMSDLS